LTDRPFLLVIAGPNGSGKSTLISYLGGAGVDFGIHINPDDIARTLDLPEPQRTAQAQAIADFKRDTCLQRRESFSFETVMSHPSKVQIMVRAHDAGYEVALYFVATSDPEINVRRVENRVSTGGHDVPHDRIRARYSRALNLLSHVGKSPHAKLVNAKSGLRPVAEVICLGNRYDITLEADVPQWVFEHLVMPLDSVARASEGGLAVVVNQRHGPFA